MSAFKKFNSLTGDDKQPEVHIELALQGVGPDPTKSSLEPTNDSLPPVDRGTKAWSAIAGGFLALFVQFGLGTFDEPPKTQNNLPLVRHPRCTLDLMLGSRPVLYSCLVQCPCSQVNCPSPDGSAHLIALFGVYRSPPQR